MRAVGGTRIRGVWRVWVAGENGEVLAAATGVLLAEVVQRLGARLREREMTR